MLYMRNNNTNYRLKRFQLFVAGLAKRFKISLTIFNYV